jgi:ABC-type transporter Mla MlaB component
MLNCSIVVRESNELYVDGVINFANASRVMKLGCKLIAKLPTVDVNLHNLKHSDSSGLAVISAWVRYALTNNKVLKIYHMPDFLLDISKVSNLDNIFPIES